VCCAQVLLQKAREQDQYVVRVYKERVGCPLLPVPSGCRCPGEGVDAEEVDDGDVYNGDALKKGKDDVPTSLDPQA
jgi:hypothetical protein